VTKTRIRACLVCHTVRRIRARGLCDMCHDRAWRTGRIEEHAPTKVDRMGQVRPLWEADMPAKDIAAALGCSRDAVDACVKRLRVEGTVQPSGVWEQLHVPEPPERPACTEADPALFDIAFLPHGRTSVVRNGKLLGNYAVQIEAAFRYCAACPVREWCRDEAVRPKQSHANIITGGEVWVSGRRVWSLDEHDVRDSAGAA
jgi:hypothetical protein